jgi:hypothetical protein
MARITCTELDWTKSNKKFQIIWANVDVLMLDVLDTELGDLYHIKCESITEGIKMLSWSDIQWMIWIGNNKDSEVEIQS